MQAKKIVESILDTPKPDLDSSVWRKDGTDGKYALTDVANARIAKLLKWFISKYDMPDLKVFIIGSITSNQYSDNSDIDINICSSAVQDKEKAAEICKKVKTDYAAYMEQCPKDCKVGTHPFEIYIQYNPYRCLASVGCYDFLAQEWKVGPDMKKQSYDPTSEYYDKGRRFLGTSLKDIRNTILDIYETALVAKKSNNAKFKKEKFNQILKKLPHAQKVFMKVHNDRGDYDEKIDSEKNAMKMRDNKQRNKADATYKFLDKFGYVQILREYSNLRNETDNKRLGQDELLTRIITVVKQNLDAEKTLSNEGDALLESRCLQFLKKITFPVKEWAALKQQDEIITTRVSDEAGKYNVGDVVVSPWKTCYKVASIDHVEHLVDHPYYDELTDEQIEFLLGFDRMDVVKLERMDLQNESMRDMVSVAVLAAMIAVPGLVPQQALAKEMKKIPKAELRFNSPAVSKAMQAVALEDRSWNGLGFVNMTNVLTTISYNEAMLDYVKTGDTNVLIAVLNMIDNRAGGDPANYIAEILRPSQFFSAKFVSKNCEGGICTDKTYKKWDPHVEAGGALLGSKPEEAWRLCAKYSVMLLKKELPNVIGDRNMLANAKIDKTSAWEKWGKHCDLQIGTQLYGYQRMHDGYLKYKKPKPANLNHNPTAKTVKYTIKPGDTLGAIAKKHNTTISRILIRNKIPNVNQIRAGQTIIIG